MPGRSDHGTRPAIRLLAGVLFFVGTFWAVVAWYGVVAGPGMILALIRHEVPPDGEWGTILFAFGLSLQSICGYLVWGSWLAISAGWLRSVRWFWILAVVHHLTWIPFAWSPNRTIGIDLYLLIVTLACLFAATLSQNCGGPKVLKDQPAAAS